MKSLIYILSVFFITQSFAQRDFNNYTTLLSSGETPTDFTQKTYLKIEEQSKITREGLTKAQQKEFLEAVNYGIDDILQSNLVIYGDDISIYVEEIATKLLQNQPEVLKRLQFFTLKTNETNALSTDQGIIFVTTGLISQLTSEAQLAYILAHEIAHYTENHVIDKFEFKSNNTTKNYSTLSKYSKEKELDADRLAVKLYNNAGYSRSEISPTFDVLLYSYLPFEEIPFSNDYFNTSTFYVSESQFTKEVFEIKAREDIKDENSSHPNILKRKTAAEKEISEFESWDKGVNQLGNERFKVIRNIARFESIRTNLIDAEFVQALYSIAVLEKDFPQSYYLKRMKAQTLLGIAQFKNGGISSPFSSSQLKEGEIARLQYFFKKIDKKAILSVSLRIIYDLQIQYPESIEIKSIYTKMVETCANNKDFELDKFSNGTFSEASQKLEQTKIFDDSLSQKNDTIEKVDSKYTRIKQKKNIDFVSQMDSSKFYLYGMTDVISNSSFISEFNRAREEVLNAQKIIDDFNDLSREEKSKVLFDERKQDKMDLKNKPLFSETYRNSIVVDPIFVEQSKKGLNPQKTEILEQEIADMILENGTQNGMNLSRTDRESIAELGSEEFNKRNILFTCVEQSSNYEKINYFPVDFSLIQDIKKKSGKDYALFFLTEHDYDADIQPLYIVAGVLFVITIPVVVFIYIPERLMNANHTRISSLALNLETGKITDGYNSDSNLRVNKLNLNLLFYSIFNQ